MFLEQFVGVIIAVMDTVNLWLLCLLDTIELWDWTLPTASWLGQHQCCGCSSTTGLARCQYCLHTACKYHMFYIPALNGGDLACVHCRTIEIDGERPCQCCNGYCLSPVLHCGGALRIITHSPTGKAIHDIPECGALTAQRFMEIHDWTNVCLIWHHHVLHPDLLFADYKLSVLVLIVLPNCANTDDMTEIRPLDQCKASATWSFAEFSFWHSFSIQNFIMAAQHPPCQSEYYGHDSMEYAHRGWLADIVERRNQAIDMMSSWRNVKRRITKKRKSPTCSSTLIYDSVTQPPSITRPEVVLAGGASDSAIKQKLAKKASQAGVNHAQDLLQLVWGENAAELRQLWGSAPEVRAKLLAMARNSTQVMDPGKYFPVDPVFEGDPWSKFTGGKPADSMSTSASSSKSKPPTKQSAEALV
eukprot:3180085-Amphidinium_carterae.1